MFLIVDNNSQDNTAEIVRVYQEKWSSLRSLRYSCEQRQGAAFARQRAIKESRSQWVGFLDDDVIPAHDWVAKAYDFSQKYPRAGAYGGQIHGDFEVNPPSNFQRIASFLAIRERGSNPQLYDAINLSLPPSAAWLVRRKAWLECVPPILL